MREIKADIEKMRKTVCKVSTLLDAEAHKSNFDKYNEFESLDAWDHSAGAARVALLRRTQ